MNAKRPRKYELKKRADALEETRRRITEATVELHRTVGPVATRITDVAKKAGVQRVTVYNHFPDESSLMASCSAHWRALHPSPNPSAWLAIADPGVRLRTGLGELYAWYRETEPMTANVLRDAETIPALRKIIDNGLGMYLARVQEILAKFPNLRGRRRERVKAAVRVATDFHTWRGLADLGDDEAAGLAARLVEAAAET
jgi:AcrR family transcriptional regulator